MGYNVVNVSTGSAGSFSSVYTDRVSDDPGKLSDVISDFSQTDVGKSLSSKGVDLTNYLRAREEYVVLNIYRYFSRMTSEEAARSSSDSFLEIESAKKNSYVVSNNEALTLRKSMVNQSFTPIYKPFSLSFLRNSVVLLMDDLPDCQRKRHFSRNGYLPFVEPDDAYKNGGFLLKYSPVQPNVNGVHYSRYIDYVVSRLVKISLIISLL